MDTAGNVLEWTASLYGSYPYPPQGREEPSLAGCRVVRGGSYGGGRPELFGCSVRLMIQPAVAVEVKGFRVARSCP
ncbi:MAG: formylglycine-generating enzyme family protein, partial [Armatimonadetes bacterium]|nr:formylglycine-generating enzyme family protein [Armatimonadota bacterium]